MYGKVAIITGANQGLGLEIAKMYVANGASVLIFARDEALLNEAKVMLSAKLNEKQKIMVFAGDVSNELDVERLISVCLSEFGQLDILVNNAGIYGPKGGIDQVDWKGWVKSIEINLFGSVLTSRAVIPHFKKQKKGKIIQLSGGGATNPMPFLSSYAVSKAGIVRFVETLAGELCDYNVDVNAIAPGALNTRLLDEIIEAGPDKVGKDFYERSLKQKSTGGSSLEIGAQLAVFLGSDISNGITGKLISAIWDKWEDWPKNKKTLNESDVYTLRRIAGRDRSMEWGDK